MRLHIPIILVLSVIAHIPRDCNCDSSVQNSEDSRLASAQSWEKGSDPELYGEQYEGEPEMNKRVRNRGTKRRRRLRPRPRTTERSFDSDMVDELHTAASSLEGMENEEIIPRRRPTSKRRRRPLRRYQDSDQPRPRRRKGGRKRIRPPVINAEEIETTTFISADYDSPVTTKFMLGEENTGEVNTEKISYDKYYKNDNTRFSSTERSSYKSYEIENSNSTTKRITQFPEVKDNYDKEENNELIVPQVEKIMINENNSTNEFGNKIVNRKTLFSTSRKLPETSATLRRRLKPRIKNLSNNSTFENHVRIIKPLANLESEIESHNKMKNEVITQPAFTEPPISVEPYKIINTINSEAPNDHHLEEPNYPKLDLFIKRNKTIFQEDIKEVTTPYPITTTVINLEMTTLVQDEFEQEVKSTVQHSINKSNSISKVPIDDEVFDLLKSEAGSNRLKRILELRNMTLPQLLDHRERGSSKFHLSDIFSKTQSKSKEIDKPREVEVNVTELSEGKNEDSPDKSEQENNPTTPPNFVTENTLEQKKEQPEQPQDVHNSEKEAPPVTTQYRESRIFDSMPDFTSTKASIPELRPYPTWRVIPNPKLKPVSIRGDYKEIKISNVLTTHKPFVGNDIDKIFLLEEQDNFIQHRNKIAATISAENHERTFWFRKIPVSVKSAIVISGAILVLAIFGFLSVLVSCRLRQKKARLRAKQDILCEHLQNDDFMTSQQSLSPVLNKHNRGPVFSHGVHSNTPSTRHYYLWRTLRKTFQYD
uniref:Putative serine/threonine-protein kinase nek3 n=1 Tax=Panstrongylus lignarius TaxID=156445 RepID=A0A224XKA7_9HEMI